MAASVPTILDEIVRDTRGVIESRRTSMPASALREQEWFSKACISLESALKARPFSIIAEAKKASPSKGVLREDFDPVAITLAYQKAGASAVSILTEPLHFKGDIQYLSTCRRVLDIPILRKDFIVDPYQVIEAKAYGADAILLIATILGRNQLKELQAAARELGLSVLVEVYSGAELDRVDVDNTPIIGANSRNLHSFEVDLMHAVDVLRSLPESCIRIAESGITSGADLEFLARHGVDGALIGESFMRQPDPGLALAAFLTALS